MEKKYFFTPNGFKKLKEVVAELGEQLRRVAEQKTDSAEAGGNGWHDNFAFEELIREEHRLWGELSALEEVLNRAEIINPVPGTDSVRIGSRVMLGIGSGEPEEYEIVGHMESDPKLRKISYDSPLGAAVLGAKPDDERAFQSGGASG